MKGADILSQNNSIRGEVKNLGTGHNVSLRVIEPGTNKLVRTHRGHNRATNSLMTGIAHYLQGDGILNQGSSTLSAYIPRFISLGTMGLVNQLEDNEGLPMGIGYKSYRQYNTETGQWVYDRYDSLTRKQLDFLGVYDYPMPILRSIVRSKVSPDYYLGSYTYGGDLTFVPIGNASRFMSSSAAEYALRSWITAQGADADDWATRYQILSIENCTCSSCRGMHAIHVNDTIGSIADRERRERLTEEQEEALRFYDYMRQVPGYGADGYDLNQNNGRTSTADSYIMAGLGPPFSMRGRVGAPIIGELPYPDTRPCTHCGEYCTCGCCVEDWDTVDLNVYDTVRCELISDSFPRQHITYRDIIPEEEAELPQTVDVVFSAMISTGALRQFRRLGQDFIFITEAGLWSRRDWILSGNNGLLAGYRLTPPNKDNWTVYPNHSIHMDRWYTENDVATTSIPTSEERMAAIDYAKAQINSGDFNLAKSNRRIIKQSVLKVGVNQVVQVIWKIQLGAIEQLFPGSFCPDCRREFEEPGPRGDADEPGTIDCHCDCIIDGGDIDNPTLDTCTCAVDSGEIN